MSLDDVRSAVTLPDTVTVVESAFRAQAQASS